jgi:hypothetical protein
MNLGPEGEYVQVNMSLKVNMSRFLRPQNFILPFCILSSKFAHNHKFQLYLHAFFSSLQFIWKHSESEKHGKAGEYVPLPSFWGKKIFLKFLKYKNSNQNKSKTPTWGFFIRTDWRAFVSTENLIVEIFKKEEKKWMAQNPKYSIDLLFFPRIDLNRSMKTVHWIWWQIYMRIEPLKN